MVELKIDDNNGFLVIKDEYNISEAVKLKEKLIEAVSKVNSLKIKIECSSGLDISFFQLICSAEKICMEKSISISFIVKNLKSFKKLLSCSGFNQLISAEVCEEA